MSRKLSPEDLALWLSIIEGIKPLEREESLQDTIPTSRKRIVIEQKSQRPPHISTESSPQSLTRQQLRNYPIEGRLDLHGYTQDQAHEALVRFIESNYMQQRRALLIITGKGTDGKGILKEQLPRWLRTAGLKDKILAMAPARPEDGGQGALYVLLRRIR